MMKKSRMRARTGTKKNSMEMKARVKVDGSGTSGKKSRQMHAGMRRKVCM